MIEVRIGSGDGEKVARQRPAELRTAAAKAARAIDGAGPRAFDVSKLDGPRLQAYVEGLILGGYSYRVTGDSARQTVNLTGVGDEAAVAAGIESAEAVEWARELANTPASTKTPQWLAEQAEQLTDWGIDVTTYDEIWLEANGFGGIVAVGGGSVAPPRLIQAEWNPAGAARGASAPHVVLVGKGIVFDTGGLNIKPGDSMKTMHTDMSGAAAVLGALRLIAARQVPVRVTALVPAAENSVSGSAYRPSDVIRHYGGRTSEIGNTDAEGRLVLADAMAYAVTNLKPTVLVDIATLTGAMKLALGLQVGGYFATDEALARGLEAAAVATDEKLWRMPLVQDYAAAIDSAVADANNSPGNPGGITAAWFLRPFAGDLPWAHLDVAGPARAPKDDGWINKGATGYGTRLLADWVSSLTRSPQRAVAARKG